METNNSSYNIPERFLRQLWRNQHFSTLNLRSTDNQSIKVLSSGKQNKDSGPDFIDASIRIDGVLYRGDVEIHQFNKEWFEHGHQNDPRYNTVVLHVVLHTENLPTQPVTQSKRIIPILHLKNYLTPPYSTLWEKMIFDERAERLSYLKCFPFSDSIDAAVIERWLVKLGVERVELKVRRFEERLKELADELRLQVKEPPPKYGDVPFGLNPQELPSPTKEHSQSDFRKIQIWEQLLYEGVMEALGYSKNQESFLILARNVRLKFLYENIPRDSNENSEHIESILFAAAGLLLKHSKGFDGESIKHLRVLKRLWKQHKTEFHSEVMNGSAWQFFRLRPDNFPTIRITGAAKLIQRFIQDSVLKTIVQILKAADLKSQDKYSSIIQLFIVPIDGFWSTHYRFGERSQTIRTKLIGKSRADEIVLNAVIPIALLYARIFKDKDIRQEILSLYEHCPLSSENTITRTISHRLLKEKMQLDTVLLQQGAIQLYKFYCTEERCGDCEVGKAIHR